MLKPFRRQPAQDDHESLFMRLYDQLLRQATELTGDAAQAEDLLHDAFINFTLRRPALDQLHNAEGYLYRMIRNLFVSEVRRRAQMQTVPLAPGDYETVELGLRALPSNNQTCAELLSLCHYACVRKESATAASALILRFFHGYALQEVATLLRAPKQQITDWLKLARREARLFLTDPARLKFLSGASSSNFPAPAALHPSVDVIEQLRALILQSRQGECFTTADWRQLYSAEKRWALETPFAAHLASCAACLQIVSGLHRMPTPDDRDPTAMSGSDDRPAPPRRKPPKSNHERLRICQQRRAETFAHHPSELHIAVNGFVLLSQTLAAAVNEQTIRVNIDEAISFVEVFSEQGVRLLLLEIEPPTDGALEQNESLALSDGRRLNVTLTCDRVWPQLHIVYFDPTLEDYGARKTEDEMAEAAPQLLLKESSLEQGFLARFYSAFRIPASTIRWVTITLLLAALLLTAVVGQKLGWWFAPAKPTTAPAKPGARPGKITSEAQPTVSPGAQPKVSSPSPSPSSVASPVVAPSITAALEIEALRLLQQAKADTHEQIEVRRTAAGKLRIEGMLETDARKAELLQALSSLRTHPAIEIHLQTVAEAAQRLRAAPALPATAIEREEVTVTKLPVDTELRRHFTARGVAAEQIDDEIERFTAATLQRSRQMARHAGALRQLAGRFSAAQLQTLDAAARAAWLSLLHSHARSLRDETLQLRASLAPVLSGSGASINENNSINNDEDLRRVCERVAQLSAESDRMVRAAFTVSANAAPVGVRSATFFTSLHRIEHLAEAISNTK